MSDAAVRIETILRARFDPTDFELVDDSARHAGHAGATSGGGHFHVVVVSAGFERQNRVERHRAVYAALEGLIGGAMHALALKTLPLDADPTG